MALVWYKAPKWERRVISKGVDSLFLPGARHGLAGAASPPNAPRNVPAKAESSSSKQANTNSSALASL